MDQNEKEPPDKVITMMNYEDTFGQEEAWENSRLWADEMLRTIPGLKEEFGLDQITLGDGQCFTTSVIQQIRRPEVNSKLSTKWQSLARHLDPRGFKFQVKRFMNSNEHPKVLFIKNNIQSFTGRTWKDYWSSKYIMKKSTWADHVFIQSAAWCLQMDIVIHQNLQSKPVDTISGNIDNQNIPCNGSQIHLGYLVDRHYQSLLPKKLVTSEELEDTDDDESLVSDEENQSLLESSCPVCKKEVKSLPHHLGRAKNCKNAMKEEDLKKIEMKRDEKKKENAKKRRAKFRKCNPEKCKEDRRLSIAKYRRENPMKSKKDRRLSMAKHRREN